MTSVGDILNGGFGLLKRHPLAVAIWGAIRLGLALLIAVSVLPAMLLQMHAAMEAMASMQPGAPSGPQLAALRAMNGAGGLFWLMWLFGLLVDAVLLSAAFRTVIRPEEGGFAFLRIGGDELRLFGMMVIVLVGGGIALGIFFLLVALAGMALTFALGNSQMLVGLMWFVLCLAAIGAVILASVRLSMVYPLTFIRRQLVFDEAWTLTRGRFWTLFLAYLALVAIFFVASILIMIPANWAIFSGMPAPVPSNDPAAARAAGAAVFQHLAASPLTTLAPVALLGAILGTAAVALFAGAMATAALGFLRDSGRLPEEMLDDATRIE
ncbi:hypothetical protein [Sphingomonas sp.]|uniref:hypothetical protein n=1 Tax=Sphingomonas sp. TaxID=28214 RepID=UPI001B12F767|nr:hypothetical protein [Sphingomonas sp.]MBO9715048.1 hypothetical protein [Sphingomonas sp.]